MSGAQYDILVLDMSSAQHDILVFLEKIYLTKVFFKTQINFR